MADLYLCPACKMFYDPKKEQCPFCGHPREKPVIVQTAGSLPDIPPAMPPDPKDAASPLSPPLSFAAKVTGLLLRPTVTFRAIKHENLGAAYIHYLMAFAIFSVMWTVLFTIVLSRAVPQGTVSGFTGPYHPGRSIRRLAGEFRRFFSEMPVFQKTGTNASGSICSPVAA
ncbi:hypothetical protein [Methanoregula sp. PtaB.Bin085]|uniref:hypothetical protein n=1 Tax=Methanoregula sp. PtaB.Bin085 TaxID=1811680 RepID=UPI0009C5CD57|nr:hypothetical protein [Methanoregula sp. PtaB.Bin085]OPX61566.1 MAG: hypothetical protein A4E33_02918 [Methanoregula sp. PtaB.Bin085]